jgi:predicted ATPase
MMRMPITSMHIEGFKSIRTADLELRSLNVLIGANGAGKSNFVELFRLLNQMIEGRLQVAVQKAGGASGLLYYGPKRTEQIDTQFWFGDNGYRCTWAPTADDGLVFNDEEVLFQARGYPRPYSEHLGSGHRETQLIATRSKIASYVMDGLRGWRVYHFHDTSASAAIKLIGDLHDDRMLRGDAGNLAAFLYRLQQGHADHYGAIRDTIRLVAPFFDDFVLQPLAANPDKIRLEWRERDSDYPFLAHHLSDGTLRFICLATLLLQPVPPATVLLDEPELGLHPYAISVLASLIRSVAQRTQLVISSQSVTFVNEFNLEDLLVVDRKGQETVFTRLDRERLASWLEEYALGELWEKNVLGGRPAR